MFEIIVWLQVWAVNIINSVHVLSSFFLQIFTLLSMLAVLSTHLPILIKLLPMLIFQSRKCFFFPPILDYHFISQPWKDCFQHWIIISFTILGNTGSNIGLSVHLPTLQRWFPILDFQFIYQHWTFFTFTNLGNAVSNDGFSLHLPTLVN